MKKRGSAIIIAVLLVSAIGGIAFGFGRALFAELATAAIPENGIGAYYAAESGVEEALLRYRYDKNAEVAYDGKAITDQTKKIFRNNITTPPAGGQEVGNNPTTLAGISRSALYPTGPLSDQIYEMKMGSKVTALTDHKIIRDEVEKFDLGSFSGGTGNGEDVTLTLTHVPGSSAIPFPANCAMVEARLTGNIGAPAGPLKEFKKIFYNGAATCTVNSSVLGSADPDSKFDYRFGADYKVVSLMAQIRGASAPALHNAILTLKPIGGGVTVALSLPAGYVIPKINGSELTVNSTGYYGQAVRTIEVKLDRQSGTLYDLFDYVIYKP